MVFAVFLQCLPRKDVDTYAAMSMLPTVIFFFNLEKHCNLICFCRLNVGSAYMIILRQGSWCLDSGGSLSLKSLTPLLAYIVFRYQHLSPGLQNFEAGVGACQAACTLPHESTLPLRTSVGFADKTEVRFATISVKTPLRL